VTLSQEERYSAAGLFTVALYSRQAAMLNPPTASVEAELTAGEPTEEAAKEATPAGKAAKGHPPADPLDGVLAPVSGKEAAASTKELATRILARLGLSGSSAEGVLELPNVSSSLKVREGLQLFLQPLAAGGSKDDHAGVEASLARIIRKLVAATYLWLDEVEAEKEHETAGDSAGLTAQQMAATAAAIMSRWHDSRAARAVLDLCGWLREQGAPPGRTVEAWMADYAAQSLAGHKEVAAQFSAAPSWGMKRMLLVGGTTAVAGTMLAVTGGLAAPAIAAGLSSAASVFGGAGAAAAVSGVATTATVTGAAAATGAGYGGQAMMRRTREVKEFAFLLQSDLLQEPGAARRVRLSLQVDERSGSPVTAELSVQAPEEPDAEAGTGMTASLKKMFGGMGSGFGWRSSKSSTKEPRAPAEAPKGAPEPAAADAEDPVAFPERPSGWRKWGDEDLLSLPWPKTPKAKVVPECTICVAGWVPSRTHGFVEPFCKALAQPRGWGQPEAYCLVWESKQLVALHDALMNMVKSYASGKLKSYFLTHYVSAGLMSSIALPASLLAATTTIIDNSWSTALDRADKAGLLLAQRLVSTAPASRPVRLVGFSMGARLIFSCLLELARCGHRGVVSEVLLVGAPVSLSPNKWASARSVVAGDFVNGYCGNDWLLGVVYATTQAFVKSAAGLRPVGSVCPDAGVRDVDLLAAGLVSGHTDYPAQMGRIMAEVGMA